MKRIYVIGAGSIGSRHLQALKAVKRPLDITVVDPAPGALRRAEQRFLAGRGKTRHHTRYVATLPHEPSAMTSLLSPPTRTYVVRSLKRCSTERTSAISFWKSYCSAPSLIFPQSKRCLSAAE